MDKLIQVDKHEEEGYIWDVFVHDEAVVATGKVHAHATMNDSWFELDKVGNDDRRSDGLETDSQFDSDDSNSPDNPNLSYPEDPSTEDDERGIYESDEGLSDLDDYDQSY